MKILIATGIYPPDIGGPAMYSKNIFEELSFLSHKVKVLPYKLERFLPTGIRHIFYFFRLVFNILNADFIIAMDTYSVGLPAVFAAKIFNKKILIRTGGDFLWESYVERTGDMVLFRDFYKKRMEQLSPKEQIIFKLTKWVLRHANALVWSTLWQRDIFTSAYGLDTNKNYIVENYYGPQEETSTPSQKIFLAATRRLKWKNIAMLKRAFARAREKKPNITLDAENRPYDSFIEKIRNSYAVILVSIGDISPNMILDAIGLQKPFIVTEETGIYERIKDVAIFVDPMDEEGVADAILYLSDDDNYKAQIEKIKKFDFIHTYKDISREILAIYKSL